MLDIIDDLLVQENNLSKASECCPKWLLIDSKCHVVLSWGKTWVTNDLSHEEQTIDNGWILEYRQTLFMVYYIIAYAILSLLS